MTAIETHFERAIEIDIEVEVEIAFDGSRTKRSSKRP